MLRLLLDEHISPAVAAGVRRRRNSPAVICLAEWEKGSYLGQPDAVWLQAAAAQRLTLVTYDRRSIPPLLKAWVEAGRHHAGVIFVDDKTIAPSDIGGLVKALAHLSRKTANWNWTNRVISLTRTA